MTTSPLPTAPHVEGPAPVEPALLPRLRALLAWVDEGPAVPGTGPDGVLDVAADGPLVGGSASTALRRPRSPGEHEPLLRRGWRALEATGFVLVRGRRARVSAAGRRWLAGAGPEGARGDDLVVQAYVEAVLADRSTWRPSWEVHPELTAEEYALGSAAPFSSAWPGEEAEEDTGEDGEIAQDDEAAWPWAADELSWRSGTAGGGSRTCDCPCCRLTCESARALAAQERSRRLARALTLLHRGRGLEVAESEAPRDGSGDLARELDLLERAGLLVRSADDGAVHLVAALRPAVRAGVRRWARTTGTSPSW